MMIRLLVLLTAFLLSSVQVALAASADDAKAFANTIGDRVLVIIQDESLDNDAKLTKLEAMFTDVVDVQWVGRFVLGRHWRSLDESQQDAYQAAYRNFLIKHYVSNFVGYSGETFTIPQAREEREGEYFVRMEIQRPKGQQPVIVDYLLRSDGGDFKVFDIIVEGVSLINTQRSEFGSVVERKGIEALITKLKAKSDNLQAEMEQAEG